LKLHLAFLLRQNKSVSRPSGAFFVEALRWMRLFWWNGVREFNDLSVRQGSQMIEILKAGGAN